MRLTLIRSKRGAGQLEEVGVLEQVAHQRPLARAAEAGHAVLHVGEEALPGLLAVVADVDAGLDLGGDRPPRSPSSMARCSSSASTASPRLRRPCSSASAGGPGQAPGVGGEDPRLAGEHPRSLAAECPSRAGR